MADWLSVTERGVSQPVVTRYVGGFTRTLLSAAFGTNLAAEGSDTLFQANCVFQTDSDTAYCVLFDGLHRSTDGGATFALLSAFASPAAATDSRIGHGGIHFVYDAGNQETFLAGYYKSSTGTARGWRYRLSDGAFAETIGPAIGDALGSEILYGTTIHFNQGNGTSQGLYSWDPIAQSWVTYGSPGGIQIWGSNCYAIGSDGLLYMATSTSFQAADLLNFDGAWNRSGAINTYVDSFALSPGQRMALWSDGVDLQGTITHIDASSTSVGWRHYTITAASGFDPTVAVNSTATTVPASLRTVNDGGTAGATRDKRVIVVQDTETTPGTRRTYLAFAGDDTPSLPWSVREFLGVGTLYGFLGSGGAVRDSLPQASRNGGAYFYTPGQDGVRILAVVGAAGGERIDFVASGGGTVDVQFRRAAKQQGATVIATLIGLATGGGTRVGNQVQGVTADGVTVNTIVWDFFTDGFSNGQALAVIDPETV